MSWEFLATAAIVVVMPGTGVIYTLAVSLGHGVRRGLIAAFGCTLGILPHLAASILGLAALMQTSAVVFSALKFAGVLYLLWMAWCAWHGTGALTLHANATPTSSSRVVWDGILLNALNPKLSVFFLAFLPQFVSPDADDPALQMACLAGVFMAMTFFAFGVYASSAGLVRHWVLTNETAATWIRHLLAGSFTLLSVRLALTDR